MRKSLLQAETIILEILREGESFGMGIVEKLQDLPI
jgi:hypothetical protein